MRKQEYFDQERYERFCERLAPFVEDILKKGYSNWSSNLDTYGTLYDILEDHFYRAMTFGNLAYGFPVFMGICNMVNAHKNIESIFKIDVDDQDVPGIQYAKYKYNGVELHMDIRSPQELPTLNRADKMLDVKIRASKKQASGRRHSMR